MVPRWRGFSRRVTRGAVLLAMVLGTAGGGATSIVGAQEEPILTAEIISAGRVDYADEVEGPAVITVQRITQPPGGRSGWHVHPGPAWVIVSRGEFVYYTADGCHTVQPAGSAFVERTGEVSNVRNEGAQEGELIVTLITPLGRPLRSDVAAPTETCPQ